MLNCLGTSSSSTKASRHWNGSFSARFAANVGLRRCRCGQPARCVDRASPEILPESCNAPSEQRYCRGVRSPQDRTPMVQKNDGQFQTVRGERNSRGFCGNSRRKRCPQIRAKLNPSSSIFELLRLTKYSREPLCGSFQSHGSACFQELSIFLRIRAAAITRDKKVNASRN